MASISDVETAIRDLIFDALYPDGTTPTVGYPVSIYAGWPDPATLDADLTEPDAQDNPGIPATAHVTVYPLPGERNVTRYRGDEVVAALPEPTYTLSAAGQAVTVGGAAPTDYFVQNLALYVGDYPYVAQAAAGKTAAQMAAALQALIVVDVPGTTVAGAVITLPDGAAVGRLLVGVSTKTTREVRRQEKQFQIITWSSSPESRAAIDDTHDPVLADTPFLIMPDGTKARLTYRGSLDDDDSQKQRVYRRIRTYTVEFATTRIGTATQIVAPTVTLRDPLGTDILDLPRKPPTASAPADDSGEFDWSGGQNTDLLPGV